MFVPSGDQTTERRPDVAFIQPTAPFTSTCSNESTSGLSAWAIRSVWLGEISIWATTRVPSNHVTTRWPAESFHAPLISTSPDSAGTFQPGLPSGRRCIEAMSAAACSSSRPVPVSLT